MRVNKLDGMNKIWSYQAKRYDMQGSDLGGRLSGWWLPCRCSSTRRRGSRPTCSSPSKGTPPSLEGARPRIGQLQLVSSWWRLRDGSSRCTPCPAGSTWETPSPPPPPCSWSPVHPLPLLGTWGPPEEAPIKHPAIQKTDFGRNEKRGGGGGRCDRERMLVPPTNQLWSGGQWLWTGRLCATHGGPGHGYFGGFGGNLGRSTGETITNSVLSYISIFIN